MIKGCSVLTFLSVLRRIYPGVEGLTDAPSAIKRIDKFIENKDTKEPDEEAGEVGRTSKGPVFTRARHAGGDIVGVLRHSELDVSNAQTTQRGATHCNKIYTTFKSKKAWRGMCANTNSGRV